VVKLRWAFVALSVVLVVAVVAVAAGAVGGSSQGLYRLLGELGQVLALVRSSYVEQVAAEKLETGAMAGVVEAADPGGAYVPEQFRAEIARVRARSLPPFGLVLGKRSSYPIVLQVIPSSPAARAGVIAGELVERVGDEPVRARPLWRALTLLDTAESQGKSISVDVIDRRLAGKRTVTLAAVPFARPKGGASERDGIPVIVAPLLDVAAGEELASVLQPLSTRPGLVVDLRGVALGSPEGAAKMAAQLAGGEVQVVLARKDGRQQVMRQKGPERSWKLVVCIDNTTAGAGELLAVALKSRGATLVGIESFGDTGQRRSVSGAGGEVWLASSWGLTPDGKAILGDGLKPDEMVRPRAGEDAILARALELAGGQALKKAA
jgi:carboxyl-terminal processing protease